MTTTHEWTAVADGLPETEMLISKPILFIADGHEYPGRYHFNGWFYEDRYGTGTTMAASPKIWRSQFRFEGLKATHWRYLGAVQPEVQPR